MSHIVSLLLQQDFLRNARKNIIVKSIFGDSISIKRVLLINFLLALLYFSLTSVFPLFVFSNFSSLLPNIESVLPFYHFILNGIAPLFLFFGLFVGAILVFNINIDENEQLLSLPVVIDDLVGYRLIDVVIANLKSYLFFFFPLFICLYLAIGWSVGWVLMIAVLSCLLALIGYLSGIYLMLLIAKKFPNLSVDKLFINSFLVLALLFAAFINLFKNGYIVDGETSVWTWLITLLSSSSISVWVNNMVTRPFGVLLYLIVLSVCGILIYYLWRMTKQALSVVYYKIHVTVDKTTIKTKPIMPRVSFERLNTSLHFIPSFPRIIIIKDILSLIRKPNLLIKVVIFIGGLILLTNMKYASIDNPLLLVLYFSSMFVISRLFLGSVGMEQSNILNIKLLVPRVAKYLSARIQIAIFTSFILLIPLWIVLLVSSGNFIILSDYYRLILLILNVVILSIFVIYFSAAFAEFEPGKTGDSFTGIYPMAMLLYWGLAFLVPLFFYTLDSVIRSGVSDFISMIILLPTGLLIFVGIILCYIFGVKRIRNYF